MGNGIIGKILYFWIFILGALFIIKMTGAVQDDKSLIILLIAISIVYIVFQVCRSMGKKKREEKAAANKPPVRKGQAKKKKR